MDAKERLIVALDVPTMKEAERLIDQLGDYGRVFKVGMELYTAEGPKILEVLRNRKKKVFLDLKFHDIPNTVIGAGKAAVRHGVWMFNVHASGGIEMMVNTVQACRTLSKEAALPCPKIIAVTVLTSISDGVLQKEIGINRSVKENVAILAKLSKDAGMDGVVASPWEIESIRQACGKDFLIVTPGVRPRWSEENDQVRFTTPFEAMKLGADYCVVGRPITKAKDPVEAIKKILEEIEEGLVC
jgi:orotidine-5'-phosphate decarboxylase